MLLLCWGGKVLFWGSQSSRDDIVMSFLLHIVWGVDWLGWFRGGSGQFLLWSSGSPGCLIKKG